MFNPPELFLVGCENIWWNKQLLHFIDDIGRLLGNVVLFFISVVRDAGSQ